MLSSMFIVPPLSEQSSDISSLSDPLLLYLAIKKIEFKLAYLRNEGPFESELSTKTRGSVVVGWMWMEIRDIEDYSRRR